jgi:hypothetical protein
MARRTWIAVRGPFREGKKREAASVVQKFHDGYNARQIDWICDEAFVRPGSTDLRGFWDSSLNRVRDRAGSFNTVRSSKIQVYMEPFEVRATLVSSFEKGDGTETFVLKDTAGPRKNGTLEDGPLKIMSYKVEINGESISTE